MKDNMLNKFAIRDLKLHKKDTIVIMVTVFITSMIMMSISWLTPIFLSGRYLDYQNHYGTYTYRGSFTDDEELASIQPIIDGKAYHLDELDVCYTYSHGETLTNSQMISLKGNINLLPIELKEGRFPQNENEITLPISELERWGYEKKLNQEIDVVYTVNEETAKKSYKIVGFIEETDVNFGRYCLIQSDNYSHVNVYINLKNNQVIENSDEIHMDNEFVSSLQLSDYDRSVYLACIQIMMTIVSIVILYGITMAGFERKVKDYTLLRSIGITKRQMYYIILLQTLIISMIPSLLAMSMIFILSRFITSYRQMMLPFDFATMLMQLLIVLLIALFSYFIPARKSLRQSLTGSFENQEHQYIYYRYKKIHKLNAFYLGYRQLIGVKKQSLIKLILQFIAILFLSSYIFPYFYPPVKEKTHNQITIRSYYCIDDDILELEVPKKEEFDIFKPYAMNILYTNMIDGYEGEIFPCNEETKQYYQLDDLNENEIVVSDTYLDYMYEKYQEGDTMRVYEHDFTIKKIINHDDSLCIISEHDFLQMDLERDSHYLFVKINFKDKQHRTAAFLDHYQKIGELKGIMYGQYYIDDENLIYNEDHTKKPSPYDLLIGCVALFIFIYQYIFELFKQREDIGSFQLLGFTKREIASIYFYKSLLIMIIGFILAMVYHLEDIRLSYHYTYVLKIMKLSVLLRPILIILMMMVIVCLISLIPIIIILNRSGLENKKMND